MGARPPEGAAFEVSRIGGPRSRAHVATLLWAGALATVIAVGVLGRDREVRIETAAAPVGTAVADTAPAPESSPPAALDKNEVPDDGPPVRGTRRTVQVGLLGQSAVNVLWHNPQSR